MQISALTESKMSANQLLDYSVSEPGGKLVAYRWSGESVLESGIYMWVEGVEA